jgi:hypothetical protein
MNPVHTLSPSFSKIQSNIICPSTSKSWQWSLPFRFSDRNFIYISHLSHATCPVHLILIDLITLIMYMLKRVSYEVPDYAVFSRLPLLPPSQVQIFSSAPVLRLNRKRSLLWFREYLVKHRHNFTFSLSHRSDWLLGEQRLEVVGYPEPVWFSCLLLQSLGASPLSVFLPLLFRL